MIEKLRKRIIQEEFDYQTLLSCLEGYARPRDKISDLLKKGIIIRVKKGLYIFGEEFRKRPYSPEILANLIYGPSYLSLEYALQYYGLIPERVEALTSVTTGRSRRFTSPVGLFTYRRISLPAFRIGMDRINLGGGLYFLIAIPEKALADKIHSDRGPGIRTQKMMSAYLENDLRIDPDDLIKLNPDIIDDIARRYHSNKILLLSGLIRRKKNHLQKDTAHA
jgi:hypothetical protein